MPRILIVGGVLLAVLAAAWFLWLAPTLNRGRAQQAAVKKINGFQDLKTTWSGSVQALHLSAIGDEQLKQLVELNPPDMSRLHVSNSQLSDESFALFAKLPQVRILNLSGTPVNDAALKSLAKLTHLEWLNLSDSGVKFEQVKELEKSLKGARIDY
jgi:hypothetical protein